MIYQCTKDFLTAIKKQASEKPDIYNELFSWHVKLFKVGRRKAVYLMNDASKLSIIFYGVTQKELSNFHKLVGEALQKVLHDCGVDEELITSYIEDLGQAIFTKSGTRRQLGVLNDATRYIEYMGDEIDQSCIFQRHLCSRQNEFIFKNDEGNYVKPSEMIRNILMRTYSKTNIEYNLAKIGKCMCGKRLSEQKFYLNLHDGSIESIIEEDERAEFNSESLDYVRIPHHSYDFFRTFYAFADHVDDPQFHVELEKYGHGKGAIERIQEILLRYPKIQDQWQTNIEQVEIDMAKVWLSTRGLR